MKSVLLKRFNENVIGFLDELVETFPNNTELLLGRMFIANGQQSELMMTEFIKEALPYKKEICEKNEKFFLNSKFVLFKNSDSFLKMWNSSEMEDDNKEVVWEWVNSFVVLAERYNKL